jgi:hypothetical protein
MKISRIVVIVSEEEFKDFKIQAITKGTTVPKLAREKLFPALPVASNSASKGSSHTLTRAEPLDAEVTR